MIPFATEFPVKPLASRAEFVAQVVAWLRGITGSSVLDGQLDSGLDKEMVLIQSDEGEELRLSEFTPLDNLTPAVGFRHDLPDNEGRLWRTEAVVRRDIASDGQDLVRLRTQCIARTAGAHLATPRKPYLIKTLLRDNWGGYDGSLEVCDQPIWLKDDNKSLDLAREVTLGNATKHLPVIYISAVKAWQWALTREQIDGLAFDLGGVAHVVVEPNRFFSFELRDQTEGANVYNGTLGIALPGRGILRRYYTGLQIENASHLIAAVRGAAISVRSLMPATGWDWTELQDQSLRMQRHRDRNRISNAEMEKLYNEEIDNLKDRIDQLLQQLEATSMEDVGGDGNEGMFPPSLIRRLGPEIYLGEFSDRVRLAASIVCDRGDSVGIDKRSLAVLTSIIEKIPSSPALSELCEDLKRATKDPKRVASELTSLLHRHGYSEKADNKHIRLQPLTGYIGLDSITVPKTPSENRGLRNLQKQVERTLGITKLSN